MKYAIVFICQQGELEIKSVLLAASLRRYLRVEHELIAAVPQPESVWGKPSDSTRELLSAWGIREVAIENPIGADYPIGNKLACLDIPTDAGKLIFMDSDMLCMREFHHHPRFDAARFHAKPADFATFSSEPGTWALACSVLGLPIPARTMAATVSGQLMPPYFNAGFVAVDPAVDLGGAWQAAALALERAQEVSNKRPWLDQIALPLAARQLGLEADCLDERYNYPLHVKPMPGERPYFCHYHTAEVIRVEPIARALVRELARSEPRLRDLIAGTPAWAPLLLPDRGLPVASAWRPWAGRRVPGPRPELIITGLPRSGTSYLCGLLHRQRDCVVINEPGEIFAPLAQDSVPWGLPLYYRELRQRILDGEEILNKLHAGEFIEDTAVVDCRSAYRPSVSRADFLFATKNTLAYMARLPQLRRVMPNALIVACVRNPLDTVASWKTTFSHLGEVDMDRQVVGHRRDEQLTGVQRARLEEIATTSAPAVRRALLWRHLAETLLENEDCVLLLRYEDLVRQPAAALRRILAAVPGGDGLQLTAPPVASTPRSKREVLDEEDMAAIRGICSQTAAQLGYGGDSVD